MTTTTTRQGAGFLLGDIDVDALTTPERLTDEQKMLRETVRKFVETEARPLLPELEKLQPALSRSLLQKAAEIGICMIDIPEEYGGLGLDFLSSIQPPEILNRAGGFQVAHSVQTVIGMLPILYFGSEELKAKYLPRIATAELVSAYALTEPGSGSDALAARTTAVLSPDGAQWILNGTKMFISNGGFADVFVVFAQVDGKQFSAFVVEKDDPGFMVGAEEHKMGIKQSSTTTLAFNDCRIPKDRLIGQVGWGGKIALNVLNVGRLKLGVAAVGGSKEALEISTKYATERHQFGQAIAGFGIIREKIAEMASRIYAAESTMLRTTGLVNEAIHAGKGSGGATGEAMMAALREFNVECAIEKVHGSETLAYCVDEGVQIHGGYGFIEEYAIARLYRDARIARLYEGTNEINRMQIASDVLKRAAKGDLALAGANGSGDSLAGFEDVADQARRAKEAVGRIVRMMLESSSGALDKRSGNQEILQRLADIIIGIYAMESAMGRAAQRAAAGDDTAPLFAAMTRVYASHAGATILRSAREAVALLAEDGGAEAEVAEIEALATAPGRNVIGLRREVAKAIVDRGGVWFN